MIKKKNKRVKSPIEFTSDLIEKKIYNIEEEYVQNKYLWEIHTNTDTSLKK